MATQQLVTYDTFTGGMAEDAFRTNANEYDFSAHLDNLTQDGRMRSYRSFEADATGVSKPHNIVFAKKDGKLYALGEKSASANAKIYQKSGQVITSDWTASTTGEANGGTVSGEMFSEFAGALYFWRSDTGGTGTIGKYAIGAVSSGDVDNWNTATSNGTAGPGFHFTKNDTMYFAHGNKVYYTEDGTNLILGLTLPEGLKIVSMDGWSTYLAIAVKPDNNITSGSKVFFWDTIAADPTFVENIAEGQIQFMRNTGTELSLVSTNAVSGTTVREKLYVYTYNGGVFEERNKLVNDTSVGFTTSDVGAAVNQNQLYFSMVYGEGSGIWRFGLNGGAYTITFDRYVNTTSPATAIGEYRGIAFVGDYLFSVHRTAPAESTITRTNDAATYSNTGILRTGKFSGGSKYQNKAITEVSIGTKPLASGSAVVVKYQVDDSGSFTTLYTHDTDSAVKKVSIGIGALPQFSYIQWQLEVTGLVDLTEFSFLYQDKPNQTES